MNTLRTGLVSVTFRQLAPARIVDLVRKAGLACIEWGGDVHVPHGDLHRAREVRRMTEDAGLRVSAYGSYYRVWPVEPCPFEQVLETALELGAPLVRVWAGKTASAGSSPEHRRGVAVEARRTAALAADAGAAVAFEYHNGTLTDTAESALELVREIDHPNMGLYWQPRPELDAAQNLAALRAVLPWLRSLHVFQWQVNPLRPNEYIRRPLREGAKEWQQYLNAAATDPRADHDALVEFVRDDSADAMLEDAQALKEWVCIP